MAERELGQRRDVSLEVERLYRELPNVDEAFVQERIRNDPPFYKQIGPDIRHIVTGILLEDDVLAAREKYKSYGFLDILPDDPDLVLTGIIEDAVMRPSGNTLTTLFKLVGEKRAKEILAQRECDWVRMLPGKPIGAPAGSTKGERGEDQSGNPFHPSFVGDREAAIAKFILTFGTAKTSRLAKSCNVDIAGRPLRRA